MLSNRTKVRFRLHFYVYEVTNVPQLSGSCQLEWALKDHVASPANKPLSTGVTHHSLHHAGDTTNSSTSVSVSSEASSVASFVSHMNSGPAAAVGSRLGLKKSTTKGYTKKAEIENHNVKFNEYQEVLDVRFAVDKKLQQAKEFLQLAPRFLVLKLYSESVVPSGSGSGHKSLTDVVTVDHEGVATRRRLMGRVKINLAAYVEKNYDAKSGKFVNKHDHSVEIDKYLFQDSKTNSIMSISIRMELTRGSYGDFTNPSAPTPTPTPTHTHKHKHTHTQSSDKHFDETGSQNETLSPNGAASHTNSHHMQRRHSNAFLKEQAAAEEIESRSTVSQAVSTYTSASSYESDLFEDEPSLFLQKNQSFVNVSENTNLSNAHVDQVRHLYFQTFEAPWDERVGELDPKQCSEDIFAGGNGWKRNLDGEKLIDLDYRVTGTARSRNETSSAIADATRHASPPPSAYVQEDLAEITPRNRSRNFTLTSGLNEFVMSPGLGTPNIAYKTPHIFLSNDKRDKWKAVDTPDMDANPLSP